jgi:hypothetical protein
MSGAGFGRATRGSSPRTAVPKIASQARCAAAFSAYSGASVLVAMPSGTRRAASARVNASAPAIAGAFANRAISRRSRSSTSASGDSGSASASTMTRAASIVPRPMQLHLTDQS